MEDIVALALELENGSRLYVLTWGRIQDAVDPAPLEQLVFEQSVNRVFGEKLVRARLCQSLQEASNEPYFYEYFFAMCQKKIPFGEEYHQWRKEMDEKMRSGKELYYLGR
ncbi:MAG TPA: hypothetical protein VK003_02790 [Oceanobacillus sp.]|nr:hypothetical protein [Oceanobacillus sp.]